MNFKHYFFAIMVTVVCNLVFTSSCSNSHEKKILYVNSYHDGYPPSDDIREGIMQVLEDEAVSLEIFYLDTKKNPDLVHVKVTEALEKIETCSPDLIIASDDNAVKYLVEPHFHVSELPVVFCGVNWSADKYVLGENVTGMLEVLPLRKCIQTIKDLNPDLRRISVLSENSQSERNNRELLDTLYRNLGLKVQYCLVDDFESWMDAYKELSVSSDLIYMPTNGAIRNWDRDEAMNFVKNNLSVPTITCDSFMMNYCVFGITKVAREQGEWAAGTALEILNGKSPSDIPLARNSQIKAYLNRELANVIGFELPGEMEGAYTVIE